MKVFITGGSGFVGTRLLDILLEENYHVTNFDKADSNFYPDLTTVGNICDYEKLFESVEDESTIIHLAAEHRDDVKPINLYDLVNIEGTRNICRVAREKNIKKIIFTSSVAVYGFCDSNTGEDGAINPFNDYGRTKAEAEKILIDWSNESPSRSLIIIRPTVIFGERNRGNVFNLLNQINSGRFVMVGSGSNKKSMAYVGNVAAFIKEKMKAEGGLFIHNYIDKPDFDMNTLVTETKRILKKRNLPIRIPYHLGLFLGIFFDIISLIFRKPLPISSIRVKKFCSESTFSSNVVNTDFLPPNNLKDALENTINYEFIQKNKDGKVFYSE